MNSMNIIKLRKHHKQYIVDVLEAMNEQHLQTYDHAIDFEETTNYCLTNVYCMIDSGGTLYGFFSLSRFDLAIKTTSLGLLMFIYNLLFGRLYIYDVYIFPKYRKSGYGKHMISLITQEAKSSYWCVSTLCLHAASKELIYFYEKCGFQLVHTQNSTIYMMQNIT